jgi:DnaJ-class molecular chaperone
VVEAAQNPLGGQDQGERSLLGSTGDLYLMLEIDEHPLFKIKDSNLYWTIPISRDSFARDNRVEAPLMDGNTVKIDLPPVVLTEHRCWLSQQVRF